MRQASDIRLGIAAHRPPAVDGALDFVEIRPAGDRLAPRATARGWRAETRSDLVFTLVASPVVTHDAGRPDRGHLRETPLVRRAWKETCELAHALDAQLVVIPTPPSFVATDQHAERLIQFFAWAHRDRLRCAWAPSGPTWTTARLAPLCRELSLTHVVDPFVAEPARGRPPYFRVDGTRAVAEFARLTDICTRPRPMSDPSSAMCVLLGADAISRVESVRRKVAGGCREPEERGTGDISSDHPQSPGGTFGPAKG